ISNPINGALIDQTFIIVQGTSNLAQVRVRVSSKDGASWQVWTTTVTNGQWAVQVGVPRRTDGIINEVLLDAFDGADYEGSTVFSQTITVNALPVEAATITLTNPQEGFVIGLDTSSLLVEGTTSGELFSHELTEVTVRVSSQSLGTSRTWRLQVTQGKFSVHVPIARSDVVNDVKIEAFNGVDEQSSLVFATPINGTILALPPVPVPVQCFEIPVQCRLLICCPTPDYKYDLSYLNVWQIADYGVNQSGNPASYNANQKAVTDLVMDGPVDIVLLAGN